MYYILNYTCLIDHLQVRFGLLREHYPMAIERIIYQTSCPQYISLSGLHDFINLSPEISAKLLRPLCTPVAIDYYSAVFQSGNLYLPLFYSFPFSFMLPLPPRRSVQTCYALFLIRSTGYSFKYPFVFLLGGLDFDIAHSICLAFGYEWICSWELKCLLNKRMNILLLIHKQSL